MNRLARLQDDFQDYLLHHEQRMAGQIIGTSKCGAEQRLAVYGDAYSLRLLAALTTDFPVLHALVGDTAFDRMGRAYIDAHPSQHPSLRWFGRHLSRFLRHTQPYSTQTVLAEMAAFEWAQGEVFDADDAAVIGIETVGAVAPDAWPTMQLTLHPSVRHLKLEWNVPAIWQAIDKQETPPAPEQTGQAATWLLWRRELYIHWRSLELDEAWAIDACLRGRSFGELCEGLCEWIDESNAAFHAASLLKRWVTDELLNGIDLG